MSEQIKINPYYAPGLRKIDLRDVICTTFGITRDCLFENTRKREIVEARHCFASVVYNYFGLSQTETGKLIPRKNNRCADHATVLHSCRTYSNLYETDKDFRFKADQIINIVEKQLIELPNNQANETN